LMEAGPQAINLSPFEDGGSNSDAIGLLQGDTALHGVTSKQ